MSNYFSLAAQLLIAFGVIFELPIVIFFLVIWDIASIESLHAFRKYFVLVAFVVAAILTPPDVVSQLMMGIPLVLLYEVGIWGAWIYRRFFSSEPGPVAE